MRKARLAAGLASAVVATSTVLAPTSAEAGPAYYFLECTGGSYVSAKMKVTRSNVMSCAGGVLFLSNSESGSIKGYNGLWCVETGQRYRSWSGWRILNSDCKAWLN